MDPLSEYAKLSFATRFHMDCGKFETLPLTELMNEQK
jgi:hypothetical protein